MIRNASRYAGICAIAILQLYWYYLPAPLAMKVVTAAFTALCLVWPTRGFMALALVAPISTSVSLQLGIIEPGGLLLEQLVLGACAAALVRYESGPATRLGGPACVIAVIAVVSALAMAPAAAAATAPPGIEYGPRNFWDQLLERRLTTNALVWPPIFAALIVVESCLAGWLVEREVRRTPALAARLLWLLLGGHAIAALLSVQLMFAAAMKGGGSAQMLLHTFLTARLSPQMEVHAAGSAFVLAGVSGIGLAMGSGFRRATAVLLVALVAVGLWISGSRPAIVAAALSAAIALGWYGLHLSRRRAMIATVTAVIILVGAWFAVGPQLRRYNTASASIATRLMMAETSLQLFSTAPIFGIGVHQFYGASIRELSPEFQGLSGYARENAHNNFLQVLAEQGVIGLAAMLWWLGLLCMGWWSARRRQGAVRQYDALCLGLIASVGTWLAGHPLLVREYSTVFWLYAAVLAAFSPALSHIQKRIASIGALLVLVSLPFRAAAIRHAADLEHLGFGVSPWYRDAEDQRYREAGSEFHLYLPSGRKVQLPLRLAVGTAGAGRAEVRIGDRLLATSLVSADEWRLVDIEMPPARNRFDLVDVFVRLDATDPPPDRPFVLMGRVIQP